MAFRGINTVANTGTAVFPAVAAGDVAVMAVYQDGPTTDATTPAGWTSLGGGQLTGPDGGFYHFYRQTALCSGSETTVAVTRGSGVITSLITIATFSGRSSATPTFVGTATLNTTANAPSFSLSTPGGTAVAGDDLVLMVGFDPTAAGPATYALSAASHGLAKREETSAAWLSGALWSADSVAAGATGSITATVGGGGGTTAGYAALVVAFPGSAASASDPIPEGARVSAEAPAQEAPPARRLMPLAIMAISGFLAPPTEVRRSIVDTPLENSHNVRLRWVLPSAAGAAGYQPLGIRRPVNDETLGERPITLLRRLPESVDAPTFLLWGGMLDDDGRPAELVQSARRLVQPPAAPSADAPPLERQRSTTDTALEDVRSRSRAFVLPSGAPAADQPPLSRWRNVIDSQLEDLTIRLLRRLPESVDAPPLRRQLAGPEMLQDGRIALRSRLPESVDQPPAARARQALDTAPEDLRPELRWRFPESVDQPLPERWRTISDTEQADYLPRRSLKLPDALITAVNQPPAPRWHTTSDTPLDDLRSARSRWVLPSGAAPLPDQPLARWRTSPEASWDDPRIALRRRLPESVDAPPVVRVRVISDTQQDDLRSARPRRLPESVDQPPLVLRRAVPETMLLDARGVQGSRPFAIPSPAGAADAPPLVRLRVTSDTPAIDLVAVQQVRRFPIPERVDNPPIGRLRSISDTPAVDLGDVQRARRFAVPERADNPPLLRLRIISDTPQADLRIAVLPRLPDLIVDEPPFPRTRTISDTPFVDLESCRGYRPLESGTFAYFNGAFGRFRVIATPAGKFRGT